VDTKDNLLMVTHEISGEIVVVSLSSRQVVGRFSEVTNGSGEHDGDDHDDHDHSANAPVVSVLSPAAGKANSTFTITVTGTNLQGTTDLIFAVPSLFPGKSEDHGKGRGLVMLAKDAGFALSNIKVNAAGTQLTATVTVSKQVSVGPRAVLVSSGNGESSFSQSAGNTFTVTP
jgi:hypothetical protein